VCKHYSKAYIRHGLKHEEANARRLSSYHNLFYMMKLLQTAREMIKKGRFSEFKEKIKKDYKENI
jgi:queuine tRNA-ribosyltransferase